MGDLIDYVEEADAAYARAEKALKTGLLKWTPDYEKAANEYSKAAIAFRSAKMPDKSIEANLKAANCYESSRSFFLAAKRYEQIAFAASDKSDWDTMVTYFEKACSYLIEYHIVGPAASTYIRGARMIEAVKPEKSAEWYGHASEVVLLEDRYLQAAEYANKAVRMYLNLGKYDNAVEWAEKAVKNYNKANENRSAGRQISTLVMIHLARDDSITAQKVYLTNKSSFEHDEQYVLDNLFRGFDNFDNAAISSALKSPFIQNLENEVAEVIHDLLIKHESKESAAAVGDKDGKAEAML